MAVDIWPYSGRLSGSVTDLEHEALLLGLGNGILPDEAPDAFAVSVGGGSWTVQPGRFLIAGHVVSLDSAESGPVPAPAGSARTCIVAVYIDRRTNPWTYGVKLVPGTPGAGRPALKRERTGVYEVGLRGFTVSATGAVSLLPDERPRLAGAVKTQVVEAEEPTTQSWSSTSWTNGNPVCDLYFVAPPSGAVEVETYAAGRGLENGSAVIAFSLREDGPTGAAVRNLTTYDGPILPPGTGPDADSATKLVTGLTPGRTYYVRMGHRSSANGHDINIAHRRVIVRPAGN